MNNNDWYGYFASMDRIWAGVCAESAGTLQARIQFRDSWGNWDAVGGASFPTNEFIEDGERYLYHDFTFCAPPRRIRVLSIGESEVLISGAWADEICAL
jgi:hypothetical protein